MLSKAKNLKYLGVFKNTNTTFKKIFKFKSNACPIIFEVVLNNYNMSIVGVENITLTIDNTDNSTCYITRGNVKLPLNITIMSDEEGWFHVYVRSTQDQTTLHYNISNTPYKTYIVVESSAISTELPTNMRSVGIEKTLYNFENPVNVRTVIESNFKIPTYVNVQLKDRMLYGYIRIQNIEGYTTGTVLAKFPSPQTFDEYNSVIFMAFHTNNNGTLSPCRIAINYEGKVTLLTHGEALPSTFDVYFNFNYSVSYTTVEKITNQIGITLI